VDALLGAAALGDIGEHFPDSDPRWQGTSGLELLKRTRTLLARSGFRPSNVDATVLCERPRLGPHKRAIAAALARTLGLPASSVNVKAKTMEGLGPLGAGKAVAAQAVAVLARHRPPGARREPRR
jgi:2-C-methyl-D-erythritol 2,4-cyclodiphosphate synthase